ncbi:putative B3 domain-containing protein At5g58280 [Rosa rugosa]|uniref:putative B3 domain-containing protein At5g58280 n=1 Tax=Rosa rugosa TaxID=74645 RepID=UPI002B417C1C|nr:putative B3 domain-containing protein At5g58280 [Rosa rugosa]
MAVALPKSKPTPTGVINVFNYELRTFVDPVFRTVRRLAYHQKAILDNLLFAFQERNSGIMFPTLFALAEEVHENARPQHEEVPHSAVKNEKIHYLEDPESARIPIKGLKETDCYLARPLEECRMASYEERSAAFKAAEQLQESLQSENPSFVKSMVRSHVYSCFWLGLPSNFCETHLPQSPDSKLILEDEDGNEYDAKYIAKRTGLSGGWRGFALEHKLDDGDALVFELVEPTRFKIYIVKVTNQEHCKKDKVKSAGKPSKAAKKPDQDTNKKQRSKKATTAEIINMKTPPELLPESPKSEVVLPYRLRKRA